MFGCCMVITMRPARRSDGPRLWALNDIPNVRESADSLAPMDLPIPARPPQAFPDLGDVEASFVHRRDDFVVAEDQGRIVAMGGYRPNRDGQAEVLRVRVHSARRRQGVGRALMAEIERRARVAGFTQMHLDTATNQPEATAFYLAIGYREVGRETRRGWSWTLVYFSKRLDNGV